MAVVQAAQKVGAYVEAIGKPRQSKHNAGQYQPVLFHRNDCVGEAQKVWKSMSLQDASQFQKGMFVNLIPAQRDGRDTWDIEIPVVPSDPRPQQPVPTATAPTVAPVATAPTMQSITPAQKRQWASDIDNSAKLFRRCYEAAVTHCGDLIDDQAGLRAIATTLFEQSFR